jgi:thiamine biosynthesis lipoprotein ApbE
VRSCERPAVRRGRESWQALGTSVVVQLEDPAALPSASVAVRAELDAVDRACSRFRADSELSRLNARAGERVRVSPLFMQALELALLAAKVTDGDVDPTLGGALELAGYRTDWRLLPVAGGGGEPPIVSARARGAWEKVALDRARSSVRLPPGVRLDLGATAKAWAADRAAAAAAAATGGGVLVSLGGDIATSGTAPAGGWLIHVTDDHRSDPTAPGQTISIRSGGLATSSTIVRRWCNRGAVMHHIIDPATQAPARTPWRTVSVAAADCAQANVATTAALIRGHAAPGWLEVLRLPARLVARDGSTTTVGGWPS